jgi:hypothetical protein
VIPRIYTTYKQWFEMLLQTILTDLLAVNDIHMYSHCQTYWGTVCYNTANFNKISTVYVIQFSIFYIPFIFKCAASLVLCMFMKNLNRVSKNIFTTTPDWSFGTVCNVEIQKTFFSKKYDIRKRISHIIKTKKKNSVLLYSTNRKYPHSY